MLRVVRSTPDLSIGRLERIRRHVTCVLEGLARLDKVRNDEGPCTSWREGKASVAFFGAPYLLSSDMRLRETSVAELLKRVSIRFHALEYVGRQIAGVQRAFVLPISPVCKPGQFGSHLDVEPKGWSPGIQVEVIFRHVSSSLLEGGRLHRHLTSLINH